MKKILNFILCAAILLSVATAFIGCSSKDKETLSVEDGAFSLDCAFSLDLTHESERIPIRFWIYC